MCENAYIVVYDWMAAELHLSGSELLLFAMVYSFPDGWYGSYNAASQRIGITRSNVIAAFQRLEQRGLIKKQKENYHSVFFKVVSKQYHNSIETIPPVVSKQYHNSIETIPPIYNKDILKEDNKVILKQNQKTKEKNCKFVKPKIDEVKEYIKEKGWSVDAERWYAYYESNGWKVGRNAMKDWKAAIKTWQYSQFNKQKQTNYETRKRTATAADFCDVSTI